MKSELSVEHAPVKSVASTSRKGNWSARAVKEVSGLLQGPQRIPALVFKLAKDAVRTSFEQLHLYSYADTTQLSMDTLRCVMGWILGAQRADGGVAAYYSLLTGYSESYPEVTGYIIPTLYDYACVTGDERGQRSAESATRWLTSLQMPSGAFPGGLHGVEPQASVFNTGQILQGLVRSYVETEQVSTLKSAAAAGDWLAAMQQEDGSWSGPGAYQGVAHTYYSMVSWALAQLAEKSGNDCHGIAADRSIEWVLSQFQPGGWIDGINLEGHPLYLHFIAYVIQGTLECGILRRRGDAIQVAADSAWVLLRQFEIRKHLFGTYEAGFKGGTRFSCLTGNAQMSCVWLRLFQVTRELRFLNAALKMNEMLKGQVRFGGRAGIAGGVAGSYPIWGAYQPFRYISWGCKFFADALMLEQQFMREVEASACA